MTLSAPKLLAAAGATVTSMFIGSFFGDSGTIYGAAIGSIVSGTAAEGYEFMFARGQEKAKATYRRYHPLMETVADAQQLGPSQRAIERKVWPGEKQHRKRPTKPALIGSGLAIAGVSLGIAYGVVLLPTEAATGKTLSSQFPGNPTHYGSSFGAASSTPAPTASPSATPSGPVSPSESLIETPTQTPQASVSPALVPGVTPTPSITTVPTATTTTTPAPQDSATLLP